MSIYRPAGYGPAPTREERAALANMQGLTAAATWLQRRSGSMPSAVHLWPDTETWPDCAYCALGPDGLPCPIGTPPETERENLERLMVKERMAELAWEARTGREASSFTLGDTARALADHIIAEGER